jgi:hypothetical protein
LNLQLIISILHTFSMTRSLNCLYQGCRIFGKLNEKGLVKYLAGVLITIFTNNVQALFSFDRVHALLAVCPVCAQMHITCKYRP